MLKIACVFSTGKLVLIQLKQITGSDIMWKNYFSVTSIDDALTLLAEHQSQARIIAGGTDILVELERGQRPNVEILIDISRVKDLDQIRLTDGHIHIGPLVTHNQAVANDILLNYAFPLAQASWEVGAPQIRNRGTIAGNVITASPANDTIAPLWALGAYVTLRSTAGERTLAFPDFYQGVRKTAMRPDEMLIDIHFPVMTRQQRGIFLRNVLRRAQAISVVNIAAILTFNDDDSIQSACITMGSVAPTILRITAAEEFLHGKTLTDAVITEAAQIAGTVPKPIDDIRAPARYRTEMVKVWTARALRHLRDQTQAATFPHDPAMLWGQTDGTYPKNLAQTIHHERDASDTIATTINGTSYTATGGAHKTLLDFLREDIHLTGTKEGCAEGECGACTVFLDGIGVMSCMVPAPRAHGAEIVTVEGLAKSEDELHPIQAAFVETGAVQCGFCTPGFLMSGAKLLEEHPHPTDDQIKQSISGNLCRCTGYYKILDAFHQASHKTDLAGD